jgi:hypothetical protein
MTRTPDTSAPLDAITCQTCIHREPSRLDGYGYCKAAPTLETLGRLLPVESHCQFGKWRKA